jgi:succinoglycan biosynthesis protein ExoV
MRLYYFTKSSNFGDSLNGWLWQRLLPEAWDAADGVRFAGVGTIINADMPAARRWIVFGSGVGYGGPPPYFGGPDWTVVAVRGPLSAAVLGLPAEAAVTDGAMLLATLPEYAPLPAESRAGVVFVPHFEAERGAAWPLACDKAGIEYVNPLGDSRAVIDRIRRARLVIAEAMHAAIVADALRVPWVPVASSPQVSTFKWLDWTRSMDLPYAPVVLRASSLQAGLRNAMLWAYDQDHGFRDHRDESALRYYARRYAERAPRGQRPMSRLARRVHRRAERALASPRVEQWRLSRDAAMADRAATDLARIAGQPGMLSDDGVFRQRVDVLAERLASLDARQTAFDNEHH